MGRKHSSLTFSVIDDDLSWGESVSRSQPELATLDLCTVTLPEEARIIFWRFAPLAAREPFLAEK